MFHCHDDNFCSILTLEKVVLKLLGNVVVKCKQLFEYQHVLILRDIRGLYYKNILKIVSYACTINVSLALALAIASVISDDYK